MANNQPEDPVSLKAAEELAKNLTTLIQREGYTEAMNIMIHLMEEKAQEHKKAAAAAAAVSKKDKENKADGNRLLQRKVSQESEEQMSSDTNSARNFEIRSRKWVPRGLRNPPDFTI